MGQCKAGLVRWKCGTQQEYIDIYGGVILQKMIYEPLFELEKTGINIAYHTEKGRYSPPHWHSAIELIYVLNGTATAASVSRQM